MTFGRDRAPGQASVDEPYPTPAPGKRPRTAALPPSTARAAPEPLAGATPAAPAATAGAASIDDAFGLHLGPGAPLSDGERARFGGLGRDLGDVRIHDDPAAHRAAAALGARAFAHGPDVVFGAGQRAAGGDELLGHELAHVAATDGQRAPHLIEDAADEQAADAAAAAVQDGRPARIARTRPGVRRSPLPGAIGQRVATVHFGATDALPAMDGSLSAVAEIVPDGEVPGRFVGDEQRDAALLRAHQAVATDGGQRDEIHATALVRDQQGRFHVFDTGRTPMPRSGDRARTVQIGVTAVQGSWQVEQIVRLSREDAAAPVGAAGIPMVAPQVGPTCGASSLVSYVVSEDAVRGGPEHAVFTAACDHLLRHARAHRTQLMRHHRGDRDAFEDELALVERARTRAAAGDVISAADDLSRGAYLLYQGSTSAGMVDHEADQLAQALGVDGTGSEDRSAPAADAVTTFDELFTNRVVTTLQPSEAAQVSWLAGRNPYGRHYLIIGRRRDGHYYFHDQAVTYQRAAPSVGELRRQVGNDVRFGIADYFPPGADLQAVGLGGSGFTARRMAPQAI
ncbi:MAG: DUF4157 domain-containing protein [Myxococcales bacterium]|nr:DUF4157 domain-containing protein [Myxococcales bacterium]